MSRPPFVLQSLGGLAMRRADSAVPVLDGQRKRLGFLTILAASGSRGLSRERLLVLLWPESDEAHARNALKQFLHTIRRELGEDAVVESNGALAISADVIESDVTAFCAARAAGAHADAVALYHGPFLDGVFLRDAPEFERWAEDRRQSLARDYAASLDILVDQALASGKTADAVRWARDLAACDPLDTRFAMLLIKALAANREVAAAMRHAEIHATLLRQELGADPPAELQAAVDQLRNPATAPTANAARAHETLVSAPIVADATSGERRRAYLRHPGLIAGGAIAAALLSWAAVVTGEHLEGPIRAGGLTRIAIGHPGQSQPAISPDGKWIAFAANRLGEAGTRVPMRVYVQQIDGTRLFPVTADSVADQQEPQWSPDGSKLALATPTAIQIVAALGGTPEIIVSDPGGKRILEAGAWSHDGTRIAFADTAGVWVRDLRNGESRLVTRASYRPHSPVWSPDDSLLAYVVGTGTIWNAAPSAIWMVSVKGGVPTRITDATHLNTSPQFMEDGRRLLFVSNRAGARDIYETTLHGDGQPSDPVRLTTGANASNISLSKDGRSLLYGSRVNRTNVWAVPLSDHGETPASSMRQVTYGDQEVECLNVSPDGAWLLYNSDRKGNQDIYKLPVAGGDPVQLTTDPADDFCPSMSPDGREIAFYSFRGGGVRRVFTMLADGARQERALTDTSTEQQWRPEWSPDGKRLFFPAGHHGPRHFVTIARDASGAWTGPREVLPVPGFPRLSPDGKYVVSCSQAGLVLSPTEGTSARTLVRLSQFTQLHGVGWLGSRALDYCLAGWSLDSRTVYFRTAGENGEAHFWSVSASGGQPRRLFRLTDPRQNSRRFEFAVDRKNIYFALSTDDASIWRLELNR